MIHYHGTPITPRAGLLKMAGRHFCVSFARPDDLPTCLRIGQSLMFDNGAFSAFTRGEPFDEAGYCQWLEPILAPPHWAVIPDVIGGTEDEQRRMVARWRFGRDLGAPVWHLGASIDYLLELADCWPRICFGSSERYWQIGSPDWCARMDLACNELARTHRRPWIHGLRMLGMAGERWPLASADSTNVAQNWKRDACCPEGKAAPIDAVQSPLNWTPQPTQKDLCL